MNKNCILITQHLADTHAGLVMTIKHECPSESSGKSDVESNKDGSIAAKLCHQCQNESEQSS